MEHMEIAQLYRPDAHGRGVSVNGGKNKTLNVAKKLGVSMMDIQEFTRGNATTPWLDDLYFER